MVKYGVLLCNVAISCVIWCYMLWYIMAYCGVLSCNVVFCVVLCCIVVNCCVLWCIDGVMGCIVVRVLGWRKIFLMV